MVYPKNVKKDVCGNFYDNEDLKSHLNVCKYANKPYFSLAREQKHPIKNNHKKLYNKKIFDVRSRLNPESKFESYYHKKTDENNFFKLAELAKRKTGIKRIDARNCIKHDVINQFEDNMNENKSTKSDDKRSKKKLYSVDDDDDDAYEYEDEITEDTENHECNDLTKKNENIPGKKNNKMKIITSSAQTLDAKVFKPKNILNSPPCGNDNPQNKLNSDKCKNKLNKKCNNCDKKDLVILQPLRQFDERGIEDVFIRSDNYNDLRRFPKYSICKTNQERKSQLKLSESELGNKFKDDVILEPIYRYEIHSSDNTEEKSKIAAKPNKKNKRNLGLQYSSMYSNGVKEQIMDTGNGYFRHLVNSELIKEGPLNLQDQNLVLNQDSVNEPSVRLKHSEDKHRKKHFIEVNSSKIVYKPKTRFSLEKYSDINRKHKLIIPSVIHKSMLYPGFKSDNYILQSNIEPFKYKLYNSENDKNDLRELDNVTFVRPHYDSNQNNYIDMTGHSCCHERNVNVNSQYRTEIKKSKGEKYFKNNSKTGDTDLNNGLNNDIYEYIVSKDPLQKEVAPRKRSLLSNQHELEFKADDSDYLEKVPKQSTRSLESVNDIFDYDLGDIDESMKEGDLLNNDKSKKIFDKKFPSKKFHKEFCNKSNGQLDNSVSDDKTDYKASDNSYQDVMSNSGEKLLISNGEKYIYTHSRDSAKSTKESKPEMKRTTNSGLYHSTQKKLPENEERKYKNHKLKIADKQCHPPSGPPKFRWCSEETDLVSDQEYEDALRGKIALRIVEVIRAKVHKSLKMTSDFGFCKASKKLSINEINECENENSILKSQDLKKIMAAMDTLSYSGCNQLPYKLKEFLEWLVRVKPIRSVYLKDTAYQRRSHSNCSIGDSAFLFHKYNLPLLSEYQDTETTQSSINNEPYEDDFERDKKTDSNIVNGKNDFRSDSDITFCENTEKEQNVLLSNEPNLSYEKSKRYEEKKEIKYPDSERIDFDDNAKLEDFQSNLYSADDVVSHAFADKEEINKNVFKSSQMYKYSINPDKFILPAENLRKYLDDQKSSIDNENDVSKLHSKSYNKKKLSESGLQNKFLMSDNNEFQMDTMQNTYNVLPKIRQKRNEKRLQLQKLIFKRCPDLNCGLHINEVDNSNDVKRIAEDNADAEKEKLSISNNNDQQLGFYTPVVIHIPEEYDT
ncbi:uncharacterized protein LOC142330500 [Lycorma delicatula]|uniref:uncharacterized protein LOC142330500 n=1 Tax=Lycorma delicatula TaxID=130591 RepID=UPI003F5136F3